MYQVKQSWLTTLYTTFMSVLQAFGLVLKLRPELLICNGPGILLYSSSYLFRSLRAYVSTIVYFYRLGTCVPLCLVVFLYKLLGILDTEIVFTESFCRVKKLSLTGRILYYIADKFIVLWPELQNQYPRAEYLGDMRT